MLLCEGDGGVPTEMPASHQGSALTPTPPRSGEWGPAAGSLVAGQQGQAWTGQSQTASRCSPSLTCMSMFRNRERSRT